MFWFLFSKHKTAYEMRISDWSSDVCSSDLIGIYHAWAARTLQLQLFQRTRKRARRRQRIGTGQHVCKNRTAASRMITIIINDRGVLQAFKWFKQQRRSEEHTSELQSLMRISYAVFCLKKQTKNKNK